MAATQYDFSVTRTQIIERAFRRIGALSLGETLSAEMEAQAIFALNTIVKSWQAKKTFLWQLVEYEQALSVGVASYAMPTDPPLVSIDAAFIRDSSNYDDRIPELTRQDFMSIRDKDDTGTPTHWSWDKNNLYVWPTPDDATESFYCVGVARAEDWDTASDTGEFPARWIDPLVFALSSSLAAEYGLPAGEREALLGEARLAFREVSNTDGPGNRGMTAGAFRIGRGRWR